MLWFDFGVYFVHKVKCGLYGSFEAKVTHVETVGCISQAYSLSTVKGDVLNAD